MSKNKLIWIKEGYFAFGHKGPKGLNIEKIAKKLNKNKSSFYHYFGGLETFQEELLDFHLDRANEIAKRGKTCKHMDPDVINLLVETKDDLLFNKQLRLNFQNPLFKICFNQSFEKITSSYLDQWNLYIGFEKKSMLGKVILNILVDNFFLQVTNENLTYNWFHEYLNNLRSVIQQIQMAYHR